MARIASSGPSLKRQHISWMCQTHRQTSVSPFTHQISNDQTLFPGRELPHDGPVTLVDGSEEHGIERILDERRRGKGWQYLVQWKGYGLGDDEWLPRREVEETIALDEWLRERG